MSYYSSLPTDLIQSLENNKCILFVGSGISRRCITKGRKPLPNWDEFLKSFISWKNAKSIFDETYYKELNLLLSNKKYLTVAEELLENINDEDFGQFLNDVFSVQSLIPAHIHHLISLLPFRGIITTNYDNLLEVAYVSKHHCLPKVFCNNDIIKGANPFGSKHFILKIHGDINEPRSIVLSHKSYMEMMYNSPVYQNLLENIFSEFNILFIGYGGNDPNIETIINRISLKHNNKTHFILSKEGSLTQIEIKRMKKDKGIVVVEYIDYFGLHNHIDTFLTDVLVNIYGNNIMHKVPQRLRSPIAVFYSKEDTKDGDFLYNYIWKHGAVCIIEPIQRRQDEYFLKEFDETKDGMEFLILYFGNTELDINNPFFVKVKSYYNNLQNEKFRLIIVSLFKNKAIINSEFRNATVFYVKNNFIDIDLEGMYQYLATNIRALRKQKINELI